MKRIIAVTFALFGLALTTGAFAAPTVDGEAGDQRETHVGSSDVILLPTGTDVGPITLCPEGYKTVCVFESSGAGNCYCVKELQEY